MKLGQSGDFDFGFLDSVITSEDTSYEKRTVALATYLLVGGIDKFVNYINVNDENSLLGFVEIIKLIPIPNTKWFDEAPVDSKMRFASFILNLSKSVSLVENPEMLIHGSNFIVNHWYGNQRSEISKAYVDSVITFIEKAISESSDSPIKEDLIIHLNRLTQSLDIIDERD